MFAVSTYGTVSLLFWYIGLIPDLATLRDRSRHWLGRTVYGALAMGWRGSAMHWHRYEMAYLLLAGLATVARVRRMLRDRIMNPLRIVIKGINPEPWAIGTVRIVVPRRRTSSIVRAVSLEWSRLSRNFVLSSTMNLESTRMVMSGPTR